MPTITDRKSWLAARKELLAAEKSHLAARDALAAKRRALPWVKIGDTYTFDTDKGQQSLSQLFGRHAQLLIYHFMMGDDWDAGCPSCSLWADGFDGLTPHFAARDTAFLAVSNASLAKIAAFKTRMDWDFAWASCFGSTFNHDFHASFTDAEVAAGEMTYNYRQTRFPSAEAPAISAFTKDADGTVYHTYSCYSRGLDNMNPVYQYLDLTAKGRDEAALDYPMAWVRRHDEYETT